MLIVSAAMFQDRIESGGSGSSAPDSKVAHSVLIHRAFANSSLEVNVQGSRIRFVLGCVIPRAGAVARSRNLGQALFGSSV